MRDLQDDTDGTDDAIMLAAEFGADRLQAFMNPFIYSEHYKHLLLAAARYGHENIVRHLLQDGIKIYYNEDSVITAAAKNGHEGIVRLCHKLGARDYVQALLFAAEWGHTNVVRLCCDYGVEKNDYGACPAICS